MKVECWNRSGSVEQMLARMSLEYIFDNLTRVFKNSQFVEINSRIVFANGDAVISLDNVVECEQWKSFSGTFSLCSATIICNGIIMKPNIQNCYMLAQ